MGTLEQRTCFLKVYDGRKVHYPKSGLLLTQINTLYYSLPCVVVAIHHGEKIPALQPKRSQLI